MAANGSCHFEININLKNYHSQFMCTAVEDGKSMKKSEGAQSPQCTAVVHGKSLKVRKGLSHHSARL